MLHYPPTVYIVPRPPAADLQPHPDAYGHLVALREGDLAHLHVHPTARRPGPDVGVAAARGARSYRLSQLTSTTAGREGRTDGQGH